MIQYYSFHTGTLKKIMIMMMIQNDKMLYLYRKIIILIAKIMTNILDLCNLDTCPKRHSTIQILVLHMFLSVISIHITLEIPSV